MKINKKVLIPVFATAMGLSVVGGISGAVAWYQYNTKVSASWMGVTTADGGVLQIWDETESKWVRDAGFGTGSEELHPVTFGAMAADAALPAKAYKHPEAGVATMTDWDEATGDEYVTFTVKVRAQKLNASTGEFEPVAADVKLDEMVINSVTSGKTDVADAVRVHISDGTNNKLFSKTGTACDTHGQLDLDKDGDPDVVGGYKAFDDYDDTPIEYGDDGAQQSNSITALEDQVLFHVDASAEGKELTITIWLEGWQKLRGSAIWDATKDSGANIQFGMKLYTEKETFLDD